MWYAQPHMQPAVLVVAGEASADAHARSVLDAMRQQAPNVHAFGVGGRLMRAAGFEALVPAEKVAVAGFTEVITALPRIYRIMQLLVAEAKRRRPVAALLLDLPDFNLRLAKQLKRLGIPVLYYISPQVWAWRPQRVHAIKQLADEMLVILPFEKAFYARHQIAAKFVGHPLVEQLFPCRTQTQARQALSLEETKRPLVALLPGSRRQEVARHLPVMLGALRLLAKHHPQLHAVVPLASTIEAGQITRLLQQHPGAPVTLIDGDASLALQASDAAVVCSGTATLQAAILSVPMVVVYQVSTLTYQILKRLIAVPHIALVNLIAEERLVSELIQGQLAAQTLCEQMEPLLVDGAQRRRQKARFAEIRAMLGAKRAAHEVTREILRYTHPADYAQRSGQPPGEAHGSIA